MPAGLTLEQAVRLRSSNPTESVRRARASMADQVRALLEMKRRGAVVFDYGNNLRGEAEQGGVPHDQAFSYPGFVPEFIRPLFCLGKGPFRWAALSGDPADILATDAAALEEFPDDARLQRWIPLAERHVPFQGLPARICWLGYGERIISTPARWPRPIARPRRCGTAATRSPTGRSSMRYSTPPAGPRG